MLMSSYELLFLVVLLLFLVIDCENFLFYSFIFIWLIFFVEIDFFIFLVVLEVLMSRNKYRM